MGSVLDDELIARALQEEEDAAAAREASVRPALLRDQDVQLISQTELSRRGWYIVVLALVDLCGIFLLLLQRSKEGFPQSASEFVDRWNDDLTLIGWFVPLVLSMPFPFVGIAGAIMLYRWMLWTYCTWLFAAIVARLVMVFESGRLEGLIDQTTIVVDMILYTMFIFLEFALMQRCSFLAMLLSKLELQKHLMSPTEQPPRTMHRHIRSFVAKRGMALSSTRHGKRTVDAYTDDGRAPRWGRSYPTNASSQVDRTSISHV